ncbi:hypothetical protein HAX54_031435 [Datura stramonium]|uniref:Uncharacterized protein n=1 Tax=Datura stramonium TaxID=4076 RepID=A0ABS8SC09_DATST|nr:hypothetical protein [Datura stramonium]
MWKEIKKLLRTLAPRSKLSKVSIEDAQQFSFLGGLDNRESSGSGIGSDETSILRSNALRQLPHRGSGLATARLAHAAARASWADLVIHRNFLLYSYV